MDKSTTFFHYSRRAVLGLTLTIMVVLLLAWAAIQWVVLHDVARWRPWVEQEMTHALGAPVTVAQLRPGNFHLFPTVVLYGVTVFDPQGHPGLRVKRIQARVDLWDLLGGQMDFDRLIIDGPTLLLRRDASGRLSLSGIFLPPPGDGPSPLMNWLIHQGEIRLLKGTLVWRDEQRAAPDLVLNNVDLDFSNHGSHHRLEVTVTPPHQTASPLHLSARWRGAAWDHWRTWQGHGQVDAERINWVALSPWIDVLQGVQRAEGHWHCQLDLTPARGLELQSDIDFHPLVWHLPQASQTLSVAQWRGKLFLSWHGDQKELALRHMVLVDKSFPHFDRPLDFTIQVGPQNTRVHTTWLNVALLKPLEKMLPLSADQRQAWQALGLTGQVEEGELSWPNQGVSSASWHLSGRLHHVSMNAWRGLPEIHAFSGQINLGPESGSVQGAALATHWALPQIFKEPLVLQSFQVDLHWRQEGDTTTWNVQHLQIVNEDFHGDLHGTLATDGKGPGVAHWQGQLMQGKVASVWRYVPHWVAPQVGDWLHHSLQDGQVTTAHFSLDGNLRDFPFVQDQGGAFRLTAGLTGVRLRFDPAWPAVENIAGDLTMQGGLLTVNAHEGEVLGASITEAEALIPDFTRKNSMVVVNGQVQADVMAGLAFIHQSPLSSLTHQSLEGWNGKGVGQLTLALQVPLLAPERAQVQGDYQFFDGTLEGKPWHLPPIKGLQGHLHFTEKGVTSDQIHGQVLGGAAQISLVSDDHGVVRLAAAGQGDWSQLRTIYQDERLKDISGIEPWQAKGVWGRNHQEIGFWTHGLYLGEPFALMLQQAPVEGIEIKAVGATSAQALMRRFSLPWLASLQGAVGWSLVGTLAHDALLTQLTGNGVWQGEPVTFSALRDGAGSVSASLAGHVALAEGQKIYGGLGAIHGLSGATDWTARITGHGDQIEEWWVNSSLVGVSLALPDPMKKPPESALPTSLHGTLHGSQWAIDGQLGDQLGGRAQGWFGPLAKGREEPHVEQALLWLGAKEIARPVEGHGWVLEGHWPDVDVGGWQHYFAQLPPAGAEGLGGIPPLDHINVVLDGVRWHGRRWAQVRVMGERAGNQWKIHAQGPSVQGRLVWMMGQPGRLTGQLNHLIWPAAPADYLGQRQEQGHATDLPAMDVQVETLEISPRYKGRLHLVGNPQGKAGWRLQQLELTSASTDWRIEGEWQDLPESYQRYQWQVKTEDFGQFLSAIGYSGLLQRGAGEARGKAEWAGGLADFSFKTLVGEAQLNFRDGQFPKIEPGGVGRLIGLFSLQTLPRRVTLDFHDVFSEGFAFDYLHANLTLDHAQLSTQDFQMTGPAAKVKMTGKVNVERETTQLDAQVEPALGGSVALVSALAGGPVVGAASWVAQKLLGNPFGQALSYEYRIRGPWDNPDIQSIHGP